MASCVARPRKSSWQPQPPPSPPPPPPPSSSSSPPTMSGLELPTDVLLNILTMLSAVDAARFGKTCSLWQRISQASCCQPFSKRTLSLTSRRHNSRYYHRRQNDDKPRKTIKTCTTNKRANKGR